MERPLRINLSPAGVFIVAFVLFFLAAGLFAYIQVIAHTLRQDPESETSKLAERPPEFPSAPASASPVPPPRAPVAIESSTPVAKTEPVAPKEVAESRQAPAAASTDTVPPPFLQPGGPLTTSSGSQIASITPAPTPEMELGIGAAPAPALLTPELEPSPTPVGSVMPSTLAQADNSPQPVPGGVAQPADAKQVPTPGEALPKPIADPEEESQIRAEVLRRIDLIPDLTAKERSHLISQVERARSFSKLAILPFHTGSISPDPVQVDHLLSDLGRPGLQQVLEDPTVVLVMVGYADKQGNPAQNLELSRRRADNVINILKRRTKIENTMRAVAMGSSDLFDKTNYDRNRAVEIWLVVP